jgi:D-aminopeptidase
VNLEDVLPGGVGRLSSGSRNAITDVDGVAVGNRTLDEPAAVNTGVTVVEPTDAVAFEQPVTGNAFVLNGFGKSTGLMQLRELGTIETPLALTNTLDVGTAASALVDHSLEAAGPDVRSVNPLVLECNDGYLHDIRGRHVSATDVHAAIDAAGESVAEGAVGGGRGMTAFGRKGGIGSASRRVAVAGEPRVVGVLVLANFGRLRDLRVGGVPVGQRLAAESATGDAAPGNDDDGSIAVVVATDVPLTARQLGRVAKRAPLGMARTGGYAHHGSGDLAVAFSTAPGDADTAADAALDPVFEGAADATEEAILSALFAADRTEGRDGHVVDALDAAAVEDALRSYPWG